MPDNQTTRATPSWDPIGYFSPLESSPKPVQRSPRITNMLDRVSDLIADTNAELSKLPTYAPERPALMTARVALLQAQRELTTM